MDGDLYVAFQPASTYVSIDFHAFLVVVDDQLVILTIAEICELIEMEEVIVQVLG